MVLCRKCTYLTKENETYRCTKYKARVNPVLSEEEVDLERTCAYYKRA